MSSFKIEIRHSSAAVIQRVHAWFANRPSIRLQDGSRSVRLPHPEKAGKILKIKGAGFNGDAIRFGISHRLGPVSPTFDFDGRRMVDVASGHNNAFLGAASFQQAAVEYVISHRLESLGYAVVPCVGYGRIQEDEHVAWFSLFELEPCWINVAEYDEANVQNARLLVELAVKHHLIGYFWFLETHTGQYRLKDLHPFRLADPVNMSQLSWTLQVISALYLRCQACKYFAQSSALMMSPPEIAAIPLKGILPDASAADYLELRSNVVKPYIAGQPEHFSSNKLFAALQTTRVGSILLDLCPEVYPRW